MDDLGNKNFTLHYYDEKSGTTALNMGLEMVVDQWLPPDPQIQNKYLNQDEPDLTENHTRKMGVFKLQESSAQLFSQFGVAAENNYTRPLEFIKFDGFFGPQYDQFKQDLIAQKQPFLAYDDERDIVLLRPLSFSSRDKTRTFEIKEWYGEGGESQVYGVIDNSSLPLIMKYFKTENSRDNCISQLQLAERLGLSIVPHEFMGSAYADPTTSAFELSIDALLEPELQRSLNDAYRAGKHPLEITRDILSIVSTLLTQGYVDSDFGQENLTYHADGMVMLDPKLVQGGDPITHTKFDVATSFVAKYWADVSSEQFATANPIQFFAAAVHNALLGSFLSHVTSSENTKLIPDVERIFKDPASPTAEEFKQFSAALKKREELICSFLELGGNDSDYGPVSEQRYFAAVYNMLLYQAKSQPKLNLVDWGMVASVITNFYQFAQSTEFIGRRQQKEKDIETKYSTLDQITGDTPSEKELKKIKSLLRDSFVIRYSSNSEFEGTIEGASGEFKVDPDLLTEDQLSIYIGNMGEEHQHKLKQQVGAAVASLSVSELISYVEHQKTRDKAALIHSINIDSKNKLLFDIQSRYIPHISKTLDKSNLSPEEREVQAELLPALQEIHSLFTFIQEDYLAYLSGNARPSRPGKKYALTSGVHDHETITHLVYDNPLGQTLVSLGELRMVSPEGITHSIIQPTMWGKQISLYKPARKIVRVAYESLNNLIEISQETDIYVFLSAARDNLVENSQNVHKLSKYIREARKRFEENGVDETYIEDFSQKIDALCSKSRAGENGSELPKKTYLGERLQQLGNPHKGEFTEQLFGVLEGAAKYCGTINKIKHGEYSIAREVALEVYYQLTNVFSQQRNELLDTISDYVVLCPHTLSRDEENAYLQKTLAGGTVLSAKQKTEIESRVGNLSPQERAQMLEEINPLIHVGFGAQDVIDYAGVNPKQKYNLVRELFSVAKKYSELVEELSNGDALPEGCGDYLGLTVPEAIAYRVVGISPEKHNEYQRKGRGVLGRYHMLRYGKLLSDIAEQTTGFSDDLESSVRDHLRIVLHENEGPYTRHIKVEKAYLESQIPVKGIEEDYGPFLNDIMALLPEDLRNTSKDDIGVAYQLQLSLVDAREYVMKTDHQKIEHLRQTVYEKKIADK